VQGAPHALASELVRTQHDPSNRLRCLETDYRVVPRIAVPAEDRIPAASRPVLDAVARLLGFVPNMVKLMAISP
jgi:hypothetical protein